jgi:hypothetical protein
MYVFVKQTVKVIHFPYNVPIILIGQRINQGNFHINLLEIKIIIIVQFVKYVNFSD